MKMNEYTLENSTPRGESAKLTIPDQIPSHPIYGSPDGEDLRYGRIGWAFDRGDESEFGHCLYCGGRGEGFGALIEH